MRRYATGSGDPGRPFGRLSNVMLLSGSVNPSSYFVQGRSYPAGFRDSTSTASSVSSGFFDTIDMPIVAGRGFSDRDTRTSPKVIVMNETAARKYFGEENPIGQRLGTSAENTDEMEVIGVVRDAKYDSVRDEVPPTAYVPFAQWRVVNAVFMCGRGASRGHHRRGPCGGRRRRSEPARDRICRRRRSRWSKRLRRNGRSRRPTRCSAGWRCCSPRSACSV